MNKDIFKVQIIERHENDINWYNKEIGNFYYVVDDMLHGVKKYKVVGDKEYKFHYIDIMHAIRVR